MKYLIGVIFGLVALLGPVLKGPAYKGLEFYNFYLKVALIFDHFFSILGMIKRWKLSVFLLYIQNISDF